MNYNKGVTLISLTIYIILLIVAIGVLSSITGYFMKNLNEITVSENSDELFNKFFSFINNDLSNNDLIYIKTGKDNEKNREYLLFKFKNKAEHIYLVENGELYYLENQNIDNINDYDKVILICKEVSNIEEDSISKDIFKYENSKLEVNLIIFRKDFKMILDTTV